MKFKKEAELWDFLEADLTLGLQMFFVLMLKNTTLMRYTLDILDCNAGDHGYAFATNFNPEINLREVSFQGRYWENGKWIGQADGSAL